MKKLIMLAGAIIAVIAITFTVKAEMKLDVQLMSCREITCENRTDFFLPGQGAYIDYNSSVRGITYWAQITFPDGSKQQLQFPNRITSNTTGNYTIEMTAWKDGYDELNVTKVIQFVDKLQEEQVQNPPVLDWQMLLLFALAAALTIFVVWSVYSHGKKPAHEKKAEKKKR